MTIRSFQWFPVLEINRKDPFNEKNGSIENVMLKQQITGSIFKTVVAAAAIDNHLDDPDEVI